MQITPQKWIDLLEQVVQSRGPGAIKGQERQCIVTQAGKEYEVLNRTQLQQPYSKLSMEQIVNLSVAMFEELKKSFKQGQINERNFVELTGKISTYTENLIEEREARRNEWGWNWNLVRRTLKAISGFFSIFIIGIPLFVKLRQMDADFKAENVLLKDRIHKPTQEALSRLEKVKKEYDKVQNAHVLGQEFGKLEEIDRKKAQIKEGIQNQLKKIPAALSEVKQISDKERQKALQKRMISDYPADTPYCAQFKNDINRGITFYRIDKFLKIKDKSAQPHPQHDPDAQFMKGVRLLHELTTNENEKDWEIAIQMVANQTSLNILFDSIIMNLNVNAFPDIWMDPENQEKFALKSAFSEHLPAITLEVVRNRRGEIERVDVKIKGYIDILEYKLPSKKQNVLFPQAIEGELSYSMKLGKDQHPIISDFTSQIKIAPAFEAQAFA